MKKTCATDECITDRLEGESYCRKHKNEIARRLRNAGKGPEVITQQTCQRVGCSTVFNVSNWGQAQRYCGPECRNGAPKAGRAAARAVRQGARAKELASMTEKFCPGLPDEGRPCGVQPIAEFYRIKGRPDTLCKWHRRLSQQRYDARHPEARREGSRVSAMARRLAKITYGDRPMTIADRDAELAEDLFCRACGKDPATDVDHDHVTGIFRGMLCRRCNTRLHDGTTLDWILKVVYYLGLDH